MTDVSPHELRTIELREAWRGYRQEDVDELLDRVADTIESLQAQIASLAGRVERAEAEATAGTDLDQMLRRTLVLAQQTADEAVAEAEARAQRALDEAKATAEGMVAEAQAEAERVRNTERGRIELEVNDLIDLRDQIAAHIDDLDHFEREYRRVLRERIETDLQLLTDREPLAIGERPRPPDGVAPAPRSEVDVPDALVVRDATTSLADPAVATAGDEPVRAGAEEVAVGSPRDLDDATFFASLRDAVTDTTPLGPRDDLDHPLGVGGRDEPEASRFSARFRRRG